MARQHRVPILFGIMPSHAIRHPLVLLLALAALVGTTSATAAARRHTRLIRSIPARDTVVTALPPRLQLWFSEAITLNVSRVRLVGPGQRSHALAPLARDGNSAASPVTAPWPDSLGQGRYVVHWSTASRDGHVVRDSFAFNFRQP